MNRNYIIGFAAAAAVLALLAFAAYSLFEIVPVTKWISPSREARVNEYLALDRWLRDCGIPVRTESSGNLSMISRAEERQVFIQASRFRWDDETAAHLSRRVEEGGSVFLALDYSEVYSNSLPLNDEIIRLLEEFGISADSGSSGNSSARGGWSAESPSYDRRIFFEVQDEGALTLRDRAGLARLVQVRRGRGKLTVTGRPLFLMSTLLDRAPNARLAWALFAADRDDAPGAGSGCLFIRGTVRARGLFGDLWTQGNMPVLLVSLLVLLVTGFWAVIPAFGLVRAEEEKPGKALRERFLAEGRFLKRYGALGSYTELYLKEIRRRLMKKEGLSSDKEIADRLLDICGKPSGDKRRMLEKVLQEEPVRYREFPKLIILLKDILERI